MLSLSQNEVSLQYIALFLPYARTVPSPTSAATVISSHQQLTKGYELLLNPVTTNISSSIAHVIISSKQEQSFYLKTNVTNEWFARCEIEKKRKSQPRMKIRAYGNNISTRQRALSDVCTCWL